MQETNLMVWPQNPTSTPYDGNPANWMSQLDDGLRIMDLSIPGTHDSASLKGFEPGGDASISATQQWKIEEQLANGVRFLDLRVKRKSTSDLAMYHGGDMIYDPYQPSTWDQLYFQTVVEKIVEWLVAHPRETVIICVKDEEHNYADLWSADGLDLGTRVYGILTLVNQANNAPTNPNYHGMLHSNGLDCTLSQARGRLILWSRFGNPTPGDPASYPGADFTQLTGPLDGTTGALLQDRYSQANTAYVQDAYFSSYSYKDKLSAWITTFNSAMDSRHSAGGDPNKDLQFLSFGSQAGGYPETNAGKLNPLYLAWLEQMRVKPSGYMPQPNADPDLYLYRTGCGVIPLDFPTPDLIDSIIKLNFERTYQLDMFVSGSEFKDKLLAQA